MRMPTGQAYNTSQQKLNNSSFTEKYPGSRKSTRTLNSDRDGSVKSAEPSQRYRYDKDGKRVTYTQHKALEKEEDEFSKMFELFDSKASIEYLHSEEDDKLATSVYGDAKISRGKKSSKTAAASIGSKDQDNSEQFNESISGYDFDSLIKDDNSSSYSLNFTDSFRKY